MRTLRSNNRASVVSKSVCLVALLHLCKQQQSCSLRGFCALVRGCRGCSRSGRFAGLQNKSYHWPVIGIGAATQTCSPWLASVLHAASFLNPSRPKRGSRCPRESSELRRQGSWLGNGNRVRRGSPARLPDHGVMSGGTHPEATGLFATSWHGNFTSSRQTARVLVIQNISLFWSSSTTLSAASCSSRIARAAKPACASQYQQASRPTHSVSRKTNARITLSDNQSTLLQ